jgi:hypothetical protein
MTTTKPRHNARRVCAAAIERSVAQNRIVTERWSLNRHAVLVDACDDHIDRGDTHEYWGTRDDGAEWRVHLTVAS